MGVRSRSALRFLSVPCGPTSRSFRQGKPSTGKLTLSGFSSDTSPPIHSRRCATPALPLFLSLSSSTCSPLRCTCLPLPGEFISSVSDSSPCHVAHVHYTRTRTPPLLKTETAAPSKLEIILGAGITMRMCR